MECRRKGATFHVVSCVSMGEMHELLTFMGVYRIEVVQNATYVRVLRVFVQWGIERTWVDSEVGLSCTSL